MDFTVKKYGRHHHNQVIKLASPVINADTVNLSVEKYAILGENE